MYEDNNNEVQYMQDSHFLHNNIDLYVRIAMQVLSKNALCKMASIYAYIV